MKSQREVDGEHVPPVEPDATEAARSGETTATVGLAEDLEKAQSGDEAAFRTLYRALQPGLLRYLRSLVANDAEDVASEAWAQIARDLDSFQGDANGFRRWVATIGRHRALDHLRRQRRRPAIAMSVDEMPDAAAPDITETQVVDQLSTDHAIALIVALPREQAEAVLLRVVMGLDAASAGKVLGKRAGAVRTATHRGLHRLAEQVDGSVAGQGVGEAGPAERGEDQPHGR